MPRDNIVALHRGIRIIGSVDQALIDGAHPLIPPEMLARLNGDDDAVLAIRERLNREARHVVIRPSLFDRVCDWLGDTYGDGPRGLAWFIATLFPICAAVFAVGYFGLRELLAGFGL